MLAKRIIPCLDIKHGLVVKGINFVNFVDAGDPVALAAFYNSEGADELVFLDITASHERRDTVTELAERVAKHLFIPFTIGGGIKTVAQMQRILLAGADKISINTAAVENPDLITQGAQMFGNQCIVLAIDAKRKHDRWEVYLHGGRTPTGKDVVAWATEAVRRGAGEILLTSMDRDGTKDGFDIALTKAVSAAVHVPVIASGGAGKLEHFAQAFGEGQADAALAASLFHFGELKINAVKQYLAAQNIPVRI